MRTFLLGTRDILRGEVPFVVEEGQANLGRFPVALQMIQSAALAGADAIEFQMALADDFYVPSHSGHAAYKSREFSAGQIRDLVHATRAAGLGFVATVFSPRLVPVLSEAGCACFNINGTDLTNPEMLAAIAISGKPFFLSTTLATIEEIDDSVRRLRGFGAENFVLLLGQHVMATTEGGVPVEGTGLGVISPMQAHYGLPVGFIDHTSHEWMPAVAAAAGAAVITKHMALRRAEKGPDWHICLEPDEMARSIQSVRKVVSSIRTNKKAVTDIEVADRTIMRRSIVAAAPMLAGTPIRREQLILRRPGGGIDPYFLDRVVGSVPVRDIAAMQAIKWDDLRLEASQ